MSAQRGGYFKSLNTLSSNTIDRLLDILRQQRLRIEPVSPDVLGGSSLGPRITADLTRLPIYVARGVRSWNGLIVCFPGNQNELTTEFVGTPYLRRILYPMLELHRRLRISDKTEQLGIYILGDRFPDVILRKFRLLDQIIPHVIVLTGDILKSKKKMELSRVPENKNEAWFQAMLCEKLQTSLGLVVPKRNAIAHLGFIAAELPTGEGTKNPERLDILAYDKHDHSLVAFEIKGPDANRVEVENLFLQGIEHRNWLEKNKMSVKLIFDGVRGSRINTRKRVRLVLAFFEANVPLLFHELRDQAVKKDRHLCIDFGRLVIKESGDVRVVSYDGS